MTIILFYYLFKSIINFDAMCGFVFYGHFNIFVNFINIDFINVS